MFAGFASFDDFINNRFYRNTKQINYALQFDGDLWIKWLVRNELEDQSLMLEDNASVLDEGDKATFTLNLSESKISMSKNYQDEKVIFPKIKTGKDIQYKFAVGFTDGAKKGISLTITEVEDVTYHNNN